MGTALKPGPFKHINDAAKIARPGDEVLVAPGIYREYVDPVNAGTEEAPITYRNLEPLGAVITGAEEIKSWVPYEGQRVDGTDTQQPFGNYNPYTTYVYGDWYFAGRSKHTGCVYLNRRPCTRAGSLEACLKGEVYECSWGRRPLSTSGMPNRKETRPCFTPNFQGADPNRENVEINVRRGVLYALKTGVNYITVSGFTVTQAATTWAPPAAYQDGMIGPTGQGGGLLRTATFPTPNARASPWANTTTRTTITTSPPNM